MSGVKNAHKSPPAGKPQSRSAYADPTNYKWPLDADDIRAALSYYNGGSASEGGYTPSAWKRIGSRIASAARKIVGGAYALVDGKVQKAATAGASEGDSAPTQPNEAGFRTPDVRFETPHDVVLGFTVGQLQALLAFFASDEAGHALDSETLDEGVVDDTLAQASLPVMHGLGAAGVSSIDPDGDGDDDTTPDGDTDGDTFPRRGKRGKQSRAGASEEYVSFAGANVVAEEVTVGGVPCFRYEAMLIPADAISKNTVPGKRGPTYYSARRIRQYVAENARLLEEMEARGQRVTVYPRHAAAMLDASLPLGWVESYSARPSQRAPGKEDAWYTALVPLTSEGRDARMRMQTGLIRFSSLRSMADSSFRTEPCRVNGQLVEEAVSLPIAGVDLVATQPGLPVAPIRILEEAAIEEVDPASLEETMSMPGARPPQQQQPQGQAPQQQQQQQGQQQGQQPAQNQNQGQQPAQGVPQQYANCPVCGNDISHHIAAAHVAMTSGGQQQAQQQQGQQGQQQQQPPQRGQGQGAMNQQSQQPAREEALAQENETLKARLAALEAENAARAGQKAPATEEALVAAQAKITALETEVGALGELKAWKSAQELVAAKLAKVNELVAGDRTLGTEMRPLIEEAVAALTSVDAVETTYWRLRSTRIDDLLRAKSAHRPAGFGMVNLPASGASEEQRTQNGAQGTQRSVADPADQRPAANGKAFTPAQEHLRQIFARTGA